MGAALFHEMRGIPECSTRDKLIIAEPISCGCSSYSKLRFYMPSLYSVQEDNSCIDDPVSPLSVLQLRNSLAHFGEF
jgi:hypothetical protein